MKVKHIGNVRFQVLTATSTKKRALSYIAACSLGVDRRFIGAYWPHHQGVDGGIALMMEAVRTSETSVYCNETTRRYISEGSLLHIWNDLWSCLINVYSVGNRSFYVTSKTENAALGENCLNVKFLIKPSFTWRTERRTKLRRLHSISCRALDAGHKTEQPGALPVVADVCSNSPALKWKCRRSGI
jgi:hypothetical protein